VRLGSWTSIMLAALLASADAAAHHSFATFDQSRTVELDGTIKAIEWANPHVWIWLTVADSNGKTTDWGVESTPPNVLSREGWRPDSFVRGDRAKITIHPLKSGMPGGSLVSAAKADGTIVGKRGGGASPPADAPPKPGTP